MLYLASQSPRRRELLTQIGVEFETCSVNVLEEKAEHEQAKTYVLRLARDKAQAGVALLSNNDALSDLEKDMVLGSDTIVVFEGLVLEKPRDAAHAKEMMQLLSGKQHQVMTAIAVADQSDCLTDLVITDVKFRHISDLEIDAYWQTGEPADKAGGYAIQGLAGKFVEYIHGNYSAVVGLPLMQTEQLISQFQEL